MPVACDPAEAPLADFGVQDSRRETISPPDFGAHDGVATVNIGRPCDPAAAVTGCTGADAVCLDVGGPYWTGVCDLVSGSGCAGVCTVEGCTLEEIDTSEREDSCPLQMACTRIHVKGASGLQPKNFCLETCTVEADKNPCSHRGLACHPSSIVLNGHAEVCLYPACGSDVDCGNKDPLNPDSTCITKNGMCMSLGKQESKVGDPCKSAKECGPYQHCLLEHQDSKGQVLLQSGYCTLIGCKYHQQFYDPGKPTENLDWQCPKQSKCFSMGSGQFVSFCLATGCDPAKPDASDGCRDEPGSSGYDCTALGQDNVCWIKVKTN